MSRSLKYFFANFNVDNPSIDIKTLFKPALMTPIVGVTPKVEDNAGVLLSVFFYGRNNSGKIALARLRKEVSDEKPFSVQKFYIEQKSENDIYLESIEKRLFTIISEKINLVEEFLHYVASVFSDNTKNNIMNDIHPHIKLTEKEKKLLTDISSVVNVLER